MNRKENPNMPISEMQNLNRATIKYISSVVKPGMFLREVRELCEAYMLKNGADTFWYWGVGAFVFCGEETAISVSGRSYTTSAAVIGENDIITIDLSPQKERMWGDYARTLIIEDSKVVNNVSDIVNDEWRQGMQTEEYLHSAMRMFVTAETTFEELYYYINEKITERGYVNLDFLGNLGHSIETDKKNRIYTEKGNKTKLSDVRAFTFEPHISLPGSLYGFKKEDIYSFSDGKLFLL